MLLSEHEKVLNRQSGPSGLRDGDLFMPYNKLENQTRGLRFLVKMKAV